MKEITVQELKEMLDKQSDIQLVDVREAYEYEIADIGGDKIPMGTIPASFDKIDKHKQVVIYCRTGNRSGQVCNFLEGHGFSNLYNLKGGILAWANEIDPSMDKY
ncbi:MAG: rhodanese-like domain-containing protein [Chitinophagales bacterium]